MGTAARRLRTALEVSKNASVYSVFLRIGLTLTPTVLTLAVMTTKMLALLCVFGLAGVCIAQDQSAPSPGASQEPTKHRSHKKAESSASTAQTAESPSAASSPAASPKAKRTHKKAESTTAASPAESPAASPHGKRAAHGKGAAAVTAASPSPSASPKFSLGDLFKPKNSTAAASPAAAAPAAGKTASTQRAAKAPAPGGGHGLVWVNSETHVYHKEGSRFYGTTKKGKYMTEAEAIKEGDKLGGERH